MRIITVDGEIDAGALGKLLDGVFPSPHPPAENLKVVGDGLQKMLEGIGRTIRDDKHFKLHLENKADQLRRPAPTAPKKKPGPKSGTPAKKKPEAPKAPSGANEAPAKS
jgi:hypothetical protein